MRLLRNLKGLVRDYVLTVMKHDTKSMGLAYSKVRCELSLITQVEYMQKFIFEPNRRISELKVHEKGRLL